MRFVHAADIHLDSPLAGMARRDPDLQRMAADCTREGFRNAVGVAIEQNADFMLIAGDLYDTGQRNYECGLFFATMMRELGRPCVMIRGNHDSAATITRSLQPPPNVRLLPDDAPGTVILPECGAAIHGQSFAARAEANDLADGYKPAIPGLFNIGLLHSSIENPGEHAAYAPCRIETLINKRYDYWALGHIHTRTTLRDRPFIHFPGNTQGRHVRETGPRGVSVVDVVDGVAREPVFHETGVLRWAMAEVDVQGASTFEEAVLRVRFQLATVRHEAEGRPIIVRVVLAGATPLHHALLASPARLDAECRAAAADTGPDVYVERVQLRTRPAEDGTADLAPLEQAVRATLADPALVADLLKDFDKLRAAVPGSLGVDVPRAPEQLAALQDDAWSIIRHLVTGGTLETETP